MFFSAEMLNRVQHDGCEMNRVQHDALLYSVYCHSGLDPESQHSLYLVLVYIC